ncbi:hypothetical protein Syun_022681 [Stephania yunnanensis]|uniref:Small ribosomal subunit protein mS35 mitochondrial conserved domain-containing protein n=1 Tax=Stephania yunnanensis TaxID=152371 RepID=A0AAP0F9Y7_9MAGN
MRRAALKCASICSHVRHYRSLHTFKPNPKFSSHSPLSHAIQSLRFFSSDTDNTESSITAPQSNLPTDTNENKNNQISINVKDVTNKELKAMMEAYFKGDEQVLPDIMEAILKRKLSGKHEETDDELMEELRFRPIDDVKDKEFESDFDEAHETDEEIDNLYNARQIVEKRMMSDEYFNMDDKKWDEMIKEATEKGYLKDTVECEGILEDMLSWDNLLPGGVADRVVSSENLIVSEGDLVVFDWDEPVKEQGEVRAWRRGFGQAVEAMRCSSSGGDEKCVKMRFCEDEIKQKVEVKFNELGDMCERGEINPEKAYELFKEYEDQMVLECANIMEAEHPNVDEDTRKSSKEFDPDPPGEGPILRWRTRVVFAPGGDAFHPKNRKVKLSVTVKEFELSKHAFRRLRELVGKRYHPGRDELTITSERFDYREENRKDCLRTLLSLIEEAKKADALVEEARTSYVKDRLRANPAFMERLRAKTTKMRAAESPLPA